MSLRLNTLGRLEIFWQGQAVSGLKLRKDQALLVYLTMNPRLHDRTRLAGLLWGGLPETHARRNLRHSLWNLRQHIDQGLFTNDRLTVALNPAIPCRVDALEFSSALVQAEARRRAGDESAAIAQYEAAIALYSDDFLAHFEIAQCQEFEEWAARQRARMREEVLTALSRVIAYWTQRGTYARALGYARQQVALEPMWEEAHVRLMTLLAHTGQRDAALAQYERCRRILAQELGLAPLEETTALYGRLVNWETGRFEDQSTDLPTYQSTDLPFTGRGTEHATMVAWWEAARRGQGKLTLIVGEAGVGKTRLVEEVIRYAALQGATLLHGGCYEFGDSVPYQSIAAALSGHILSPAFQMPCLSDDWLAELARLTPALRDLRPHLPEPRRVVGQAARQRLFEAVVRFLQALATVHPLVLFLDDLHWADVSTLDLLHYLVRQVHKAPIWVVGTYRPEEVDPRHPLTRLRQGLSRDDLVHLLTLSPLSAAAVGEIARALLGGEPEPALGDYLFAESEGNPFILVETVYSLRELGALTGEANGQSRWREPPGGVLPGRVQDVILQRVDRLSPPARRLLTLAAVIGRQFDHTLLQAAAANNAPLVAASLEAWLDRYLVRPQPASPGQYDFSHDKIRAAVYRTADAGQRRLLHRQVGVALEQTLSGESEEGIGQLAYHWDQAGEPEKAVTYLLRAGDQARLLYAPQEAVAYYHHALVYLQAEGKHEQAARTLMKLGLTYHNAFDFRQARQAYDEAFTLWQRAGAARPVTPARPASRPLRVRWLEPVTLDPALAPDAHTDCLIAHLFSGLVELTPEMDAAPDVARTWEVSAGGRSFIFHLRDDVRWSDGTPVTAGDFEFAWKRALDPATGSPAASFLYDLKGGRAFHDGAGPRDAVGVRALDDVTLLVELEGPVGYFPQLLTHVSWYPAPQHVVEAVGAAWTEMGHLVSNGPFRLTAWQPGESMTLARNPDYHGHFRGNLQQVQLLPLTDWATRLAMYEAGDLDVISITYFSAAEREEVRQRYLDEYIARPRLETHFLAFDVDRPPFDDVRVRRAFVMAADRERLGDAVLHGYVAPATGGLTPPGMPGHAADITLPYDPKQARRLLAQAGYPGGHGFPPIDVLAYRAVTSRNEFLQAQWQEILGVEVRLEVVDWPTFLVRLGRQPYHLVNVGWVADYPDPDSFLRISRARGWPEWRNETYERLLQEARGLVDLSRRLQCYRKAEEILMQEAPILPLIYERDHFLIKPWLRAYPMSAIKPAFWKDVVIS